MASSALTLNNKNSLLQIKRLIARLGWAALGAFGLIFLFVGILNAYLNYKKWIAIGPGGLPYNSYGWISQIWIRPWCNRYLLTTKMYDYPHVIARYGPAGAMRYLNGELPVRQGKRPCVPLFVAPQRQAPGWGNDEKIQKLQRNLFFSLQKSNPCLLHIDTSVLEKCGEALFLSPPHIFPLNTGITKGEIAHFHLHVGKGWKGPPDGSAHVCLSLSDASEVITKGWGQQHMLSGRGTVPAGFIMIYAPRDEEEFKVVENILRAGVRYMSGGQEVK